MRVEGHTLWYEGAAHDERGQVKSGIYGITRSGPGRGKCSCGELSEILFSGQKRRQWHRDHKEVAQNLRQVQA